jgi:transcriptional regulator with PAS, ATPase and Fis domain
MAAKKSGGASLRRLLDSASGPLYVVDQKRRVAYCNPEFVKWTGLTLDDLADQRCDYHSAATDNMIAQMATALCPPPSAFDGVESSSRLIIENAAGEIVERLVRFAPLGIEGDCVGVIGILAEQDLDGDSADEFAGAKAPGESEFLHVKVARLRKGIEETFRLDRLIGVTPAIERVRKQIELAIQNAPNVLVAGPPGSGREHVARTIYYAGPQESAGMLVPLSCEILDAELLNATINALLSQKEIGSEAAPALLLLDADQLSPTCQDLLAEWLVERDIPLRAIASSRTTLDDLARTGEFRADLAFALSTLVIELPPLSDRLADIPLIAQAIVEESNKFGGSQRGGFTPEAMDCLTQFPYEENVDELRRIVLQARAKAQGSLIGANDLPDAIRWAQDKDAHPRRELETIELDAFLAEIERELIDRAMAAAKGNRAMAANLLGITRSKLLRRL